MTTFNCAIPRQQQYIIGIRDVKGPASSFWPRPWPRKSLGRPRSFGLGLETFWQHCLATTARHRSFRSQAPMNRPNNVCTTSPTSTQTLSTTLHLNWQTLLRLFSVAAPVWWTVLHAGKLCSRRESFLAERSNYDSRAHMSNAVLESLVFLKCNADI